MPLILNHLFASISLIKYGATHNAYALYAVCLSVTNRCSGLLSKRLQRIGLYYTVLTEIGYLYNKGTFLRNFVPKSELSQFLWPPCVADADIIFLPCGFFFYLSFFFSSPNLSGRRLDVYHTCTIVGRSSLYRPVSYIRISMLFLFPVTRDLLFTNI